MLNVEITELGHDRLAELIFLDLGTPALLKINHKTPEAFKF